MTIEQAVKTIAIYDGWDVDKTMLTSVMFCKRKSTLGIKRWRSFDYHTNYQSLIPIAQKVYRELENNSIFRNATAQRCIDKMNTIHNAMLNPITDNTLLFAVAEGIELLNSLKNDTQS